MKSYHEVMQETGSGVVEQVHEQVDRLRRRLTSVRHIVAVMSGKGGVGKSTLAVNLAAALALDGHAVGLVDADINGSSVAEMMGVKGHVLQMGETGVVPPVSSQGVKVMSVDLFLSAEDTPVVWQASTQKDAYTWRGTMEAGAVREFFSDTEWGALDVLVVDLPPGADKLPDLADILPELSGAVVVTIPSRVSRVVVGKSVRLTRELLETPVIGLVENMSSYVCPHCGEEESLFPSAEPRGEEYGLELLARIPFEPLLGAMADSGSDFMKRHADRPAARAIRQVADKVVAHLTAAGAR